LSFIVIGCRFFCHPCCQSPRQSGHWGRCPVRSGFRCDPAQKKQAAPGAACWKKKIGDQPEPWPPPAWSAAAIPEPGSADAALEPLLDPPPTQGCANGDKQSPGGWPAGKAVWPRLIITPGKLRGAM